MIFQSPLTCLNPVYTIGNQLVEALALAVKIGKGWLRSDLTSNDGNGWYQQCTEAYETVSSWVSPVVCASGCAVAVGLIVIAALQSPDEPSHSSECYLKSRHESLTWYCLKKTKMGIIFITHNMVLLRISAIRFPLCICSVSLNRSPVW